MNSLIDSIELGPEFDGLAVFAVGGIVRAVFTENPVSDVDLMVEGATPDEMQERGFKLIWNDESRFPVFIDSNGREVALARMDRSTGAGHNDFEVVSNPEVSVEEDLERRDFTANAMAVALTDSGQFDAGDLIDPFDGRGDIDAEMLRMVHSESFAEDPLRILRMARFAARLDFKVEQATLDAARANVEGLSGLPHERWGMELLKAMKQAQRPSRFFRLLDAVGALDVVLPELAALQGVPAAPAKFHREGDAFAHTMLVLDEMAELRPGDERALIAAMAHDLGKGMTRPEEWPSHHTHHKDGVLLMRHIQERLVLPIEFRGVMETASRHHMKMHDFDILNEGTVLRLVESLRDDYEVSNPGDEAVVKHVTLDELLDLAVVDSRGRRPSGEFDRAGARALFDAALRVIDEVDGHHVGKKFDAPEGPQFGALLHQERVRALREQAV
jgi:tRNA nucleotidyltransferase (CCA-adding enzyme)